MKCRTVIGSSNVVDKDDDDGMECTEKGFLMITGSVKSSANAHGHLIRNIALCGGCLVCLGVLISFFFSKSLSENEQRCQQLLRKPGIALSNRLERSEQGMLAFRMMPPVRMHLVYRFSGRSRHDEVAPWHTPALGAVSVVKALTEASPTHRQNITVHVLLNGHATKEGNDRYQQWFSQVLTPLSLRGVSIITGRAGNKESYFDMLQLVKNIKDVPDAMIFFLEEDYWVEPKTFTKLIEFWAAYDPCFAVPYDFPDRYSRSDGIPTGDNILKTPGNHWRSIESTTVTFACRLDVFQEVSEVLPAPWNDDGRSKPLAQRYGIWSPMPGLASMIHPTWKHLCGHWSDFDIDCTSTANKLCKSALDLRFPEDPAMFRKCNMSRS